MLDFGAVDIYNEQQKRYPMSDKEYIETIEKDNEALRKKVEELSNELARHKGYNLNQMKYSMPKQPTVVDDAIINAIFRDYMNKK